MARRRIRIGMGLIPVLLFAAACSSSQLVGSAAGGASRNLDPSQQKHIPGVHPDPAGSGVDLDPIHIAAFIFGLPTMHPKIQSGSSSLVALIGRRARLKVVALPSPAGTVALDFTETSPPGHRWGEVMFPAERSVFRAFARDASLGNYLVVLTDVQVVKAPDPIPLMAYRWARQDVAVYAKCGIPSSAIDACTEAFYELADTRVVNVGGTFRGA